MAEWLLARKLRVVGVCAVGLLSWTGQGYGTLAPSGVQDGGRVVVDVEQYDDVSLNPLPPGGGHRRCSHQAVDVSSSFSKALTRPPGTLQPGLNCSGAPEGICGREF